METCLEAQYTQEDTEIHSVEGFLKSSKENTVSFPSSKPNLTSSVMWTRAVVVLWPRQKYGWRGLRSQIIERNELSCLWCMGRGLSFWYFRPFFYNSESVFKKSVTFKLTLQWAQLVHDINKRKYTRHALTRFFYLRHFLGIFCINIFHK